MTDVERPQGGMVDFERAGTPARVALDGAYVRLEPLDPAGHGDALWAAANEPAGDLSWDYLPYGPFADRSDLDAHLRSLAVRSDPLFFAVVDRAAGAARGWASFMRINPAMGVIEIGHVWFAPSLQRSREASETIYLMMANAFDQLGYRRLEWKCNALNAASCRAAERFGLVYEGTFRNHMIMKGRTRDSAWFAATDGDWPALKAGFEAWLDPENFDADGRQREKLAVLRRAVSITP